MNLSQVSFILPLWLMASASLLGISASGQCPRGIPPPTDMVGAATEGTIHRVNSAAEGRFGEIPGPVFELNRGSNGPGLGAEGFNYFYFRRDGVLQFKGLEVKPKYTYPLKVKKLLFFGPWNSTYVIASPEIVNSTAKSILIFDEEVCAGRHVSLPPLGIHRIIFGKTKSLSTVLCGLDESHFIEVTPKSTVGTLKIKRAGANPCHESIPATGKEVRGSRTLRGAIAESKKLLETQQFQAFLKLYTVRHSPKYLEKYGLATQPEDFAESQIRQFAYDGFADNLLKTLTQIEAAVPHFSKSKEIAKFKVTGDPSKLKELYFALVAGHWYLCDVCTTWTDGDMY